MPDSTFITNVRLSNYKSIAKCNVRLNALTWLIGRNGAGKSNFIDSLRFVSDALRSSLDHSIRDRGGINEVRRRSGGHPTHFEMHLDFVLPNAQSGRYSFRIGAGVNGGFSVQSEECILRGLDVFQPDIGYRVVNGEVSGSVPLLPAAASDRLYLVNASGLHQFRPVYDAFSQMSFYNINPDQIRMLQSPDAGEILKRDGSNLASVLAQIQSRSSSTKHRIEEYLGKVVPGLQSVDQKIFGPMETIEFRQLVKGSRNPWSFLAANMSDGTLRALGVLTALSQNFDSKRQYITLAAIEEPEVALHPAASGVLREVLREASESTQIIVTSHSPDLLDDGSIDPNGIITVSSVQGETHLNKLGYAPRTAILKDLYTPGELLRLDQLDSNSPENTLPDNEQLTLGGKI